ncbi:hypothetical protein DFJ74DRAFT_624977 [Hyaloraphidium curvatum]|nr:hypothetical protein DFJ74DRAFT_624977 [Hyaloraphidium curvatum]
MSPTAGPPAFIAELRTALPASRVVTPADGTAYASLHKSDNADLARTFPCVIVRCRSAEDISAAIMTCRKHGVPLSVAAGRHSAKFFREGAACIDVREIAHVEIDPERRVARVGAGVKNGELDAACGQHGLYVTAGTNSDTGVAGLTLGGGFGHLCRQLGMTVDSLLECTVVLASGEIVSGCSPTHRPELFWAIRGAGANFGCLVEFVFRLHPIKTTVYGFNLYRALPDKDFEHSMNVCRAYKRHIEESPVEVATAISFALVPPSMAPHISVTPIYNGNGTPEEGLAALKRIRTIKQDMGLEVGKKIVDNVRPSTYVQLQKVLDSGSPAGTCWYGKNVFVHSLDDRTFSHILRSFPLTPTPLNSVAILPMGGKMGLPSVSDTAYPHRAAKYWVFVWCVYERPEDKARVREWARGVVDGCAHARVGAFVNQYEQSSEDWEVWGPNKDRLVGLKREYDPGNVFSATISLGGEGRAAL